MFMRRKNFRADGGLEKFEATLKTGQVTPTAKAHFAITLDQPGTVWLGLVSLFPPTWNDQPNGFRKDLMQMLVDLNPKFLRFPGGNYLEGDTVETRFEWKKTLGPVEATPRPSVSLGLSLDGRHGAAGISRMVRRHEGRTRAGGLCRLFAAGQHVNPGPDLEPFVQEALEEIEYVTGDTRTPGARGARRTAIPRRSSSTMSKSATKTGLTNQAVTTRVSRNSMTRSKRDIRGSS